LELILPSLIIVLGKSKGSVCIWRCEGVIVSYFGCKKKEIFPPRFSSDNGWAIIFPITNAITKSRSLN